MSLAHVILAAGPHDSTGGTHAKLSELLGGSEAEWLDALRSKEAIRAEQAFETIYRMMYPRLVALARGYVSRAVAEELAQDVLARMWERRATLREEVSLGVYLYAAVRNAAISTLRHDQVVGRVAQAAGAADEAVAMGKPSDATDASLERTEVVSTLLGVLATLPEGMRTAFALRWIHELGYQEIAHIMGVSEPAARKQVSRAREAVLPVLRRFVDYEKR